MKITIGPYKSWYGPYQLAETLCFWAKEEKDEYGFPKKPDWVHNFGEWLAHGSVAPEPKVGEITTWDRNSHYTWLYDFLLWIDKKRKRTIKVHIDRWDTWSMDHTLAYIILPMLKQLNERKHGAPYVDPKDVPDHLKPKKQTKKEKANGSTDSTHFERWDWVLDEMIFAFSTKLDDSADEQFHKGEMDLQWKQLEGGMSQMVKGPNDTHEFDAEGYAAFHARIKNGFRLFGKYYEGLWT